MKVLIIGSGGREHAMAWKIAQNEKVEKVYCAPGNGGTWQEPKCENIPARTIEEWIKTAKQYAVHLTIVGPEEPLVNGIVDEFKKEGLSIFGPSKKAAMLEGSKAFSKDFMEKYNIRTAASKTFVDVDEAVQYLTSCEYPIVIKADGLAAGKGVVICEAFTEAKETVENFMLKDIFKGSGKKIIIEEFLEGVEASILSITDGNTILPFLSAKDHKSIYEDNKGPNTGGMGVISPNPYCTEEVLHDFNENILKPTLRGIQEESMDYIGIVFFGIMITKKGAYLLEYNVRMGDPETEAVLPLMESDFLELIESALNKSLSTFPLKWSAGSACCVVASSGGYPSKYETGFEISYSATKDGKVFIAGAEQKNGKLLTSGGRVLMTLGIGANLEKAREKAYEIIKKIDFDGIYFRKDIGKI